MELKETLDALRAKGIEVALDLGEHNFCDLDTNCPMAIQVRQIIKDSGISLADLLDGYDKVVKPDPIKIEDINISGKISLFIAEKPVELDLSDILSQRAKEAVEDKIRDINRNMERVKTLGNSLYNSYLSQMASLRRTKVIPQFKASIEELARYGAMITEIDGKYVFLFNTIYRPEWLVDSGNRYRLAESDIKIITREAILAVWVTTTGQIYSVQLLNDKGGKLYHYHGSGGDCWGTIRFNLVDNRITIAAISNIKRIAMGSVSTINMNSLMNRHPDGMPDITGVKGRAKLEGKEGVIDKVTEEPTESPTGWQTADAPARTGWGRRS